MILAYTWPDENRRGSRGCPWLIEAEADGVLYRAESRSSANTELCRVLTAAGIADQPMEVHRRKSDGMLQMTYRSIHGAARRTLTEGNEPIRSIRWRPIPEIAPIMPPLLREESPKTGVSRFPTGKDAR